MKKTKLLSFLLIFSMMCTLPTHAQKKREMRGAWIATVANIDWPSREARGNSLAQQQELISTLDKLQDIGINMVVFQVRPTADALYPSDLEPWSNWLTGKQGTGNDVWYDPLEFAVLEAHKRCMDVHVWINPYRVTNGFELSDISKNHIYYQHPEWFWKYGKQWYFEPGLDETRHFLNQVVADIVTRYDVDAIHMDDYFYPYPDHKTDYPDAECFKNNPRGFSDIKDWRRNNVNLVIKEMQATIKSIKPWVEFGISPFGIWRNERQDKERGSKTNGLANYDDLYADILLWLENGWIDYVTPQLYWPIGKEVADYAILTPWWGKYTYGNNYYVGQSIGLGATMLCREMRLNQTVEQVQGSIFFSTRGLIGNRDGFADSLKTRFYTTPAIQPACTRNIKSLPAFTPENVQLNGQELSWEKVDGIGGQRTAYYVVYAFPETEEVNFDDPHYIIARTQDNHLTLKIDPREFNIAVTSVNLYKQESIPALLER